MILAEITAAIDTAGTLRTFYVSSRAYTTNPSDTPANANFVPAMTDPGSLGVNVYGDGRTAGYGSLQIGQLQLANNDGRFDVWINYGFDGRPVVLRLFTEGTPYASMPIIFTGTVDGPPEVTRKTLTLRLKDKQQVLELPACTNRYGGTNVLPNGVDGVAGDLKGKRKARAYGVVLNITPDCVNTSLQTFQVNDGPVADIQAVYDKGAPYTKGADHATSALLNAATITAGYYDTCFAEGMFRLNASLAGTITADVTQGATVADRTAAQIILQLALVVGLPGDEISYSDITELDALQPAVVGIFITDETTARDAIGQIAAAIGAFATFDVAGTLRVGRLAQPSGAPVLTLTESQGIAIDRQAQRDGDIPISSVTLNHTKLWTVQQPSDLAGVALSRSSFLSAEFRTAAAVDATIAVQFLLAPPYVVDSLMVDTANAVNGPADLEAKRLLGLYKVRRDMFAATVHLDVLRTLGVPNLMSLVKLQMPRYGLNAGKLFLLIGFAVELRRNQATLTLWG